MGQKEINSAHSLMLDELVKFAVERDIELAGVCRTLTLSVTNMTKQVREGDLLRNGNVEDYVRLRALRASVEKEADEAWATVHDHFQQLSQSIGLNFKEIEGRYSHTHNRK